MKLKDAVADVRRGKGKAEEELQRQNRLSEDLRSRTLRLMRKVELARCMNLDGGQSERDWRDRIARLDKEVERVGGSTKELLMQTAKLREGGGTKQKQRPMDQHISEDDKKTVELILTRQQEGLEKMKAVVEKDMRDLQIIRSNVQTR